MEENVLNNLLPDNGEKPIPRLTPDSVSYLQTTAQWAKFLAILGFISISFVLVIGLFFVAFSSMIQENLPNQLPLSPTIFTVVYLLVGLVYLLPVIYLNNFSNQTLKAIRFGETEIMNMAFLNLKRMFVYFGVITIVLISLYILAIIAMVAGIFILVR